MISKAFFLLITLMFLYSPSKATGQGKTDSLNMEISYITEQNIVEGCACYFSEDSISYGKEHFMLIFNYDSLGIINVNGVNKIFKIHSVIATVYPEEEVQIFDNEEYILRVELKTGNRSGDEVYIYFAKFILKDKRSGVELVKNLYGECGC